MRTSKGRRGPARPRGRPSHDVVDMEVLLRAAELVRAGMGVKPAVTLVVEGWKVPGNSRETTIARLRTKFYRRRHRLFAELTRRARAAASASASRHDDLDPTMRLTELAEEVSRSARFFAENVGPATLK